MALPIGKFPNSGSYLVSSGWCNCGLGSLPGESREPLQVSGIKGPGLHEPVRAKNQGGEAVSAENKIRANQGQKRKQGGSSDRKFIKSMN